jgi:tetratricopeptide (TPR) repeat protein
LNVRDLLDRADAARAAGRGETAARLYDEAATRCRAEGDLSGWTQAVLGAASVYLFGSEPGKLPAQLYDVLARTTDDGTRARLAAALARCWSYAGQAPRAIQFAEEAVACAERAGAPELLADCLDAALASHWGPDELDVRRSLATRLDDVAAHVLDPDARLQAHLWGLQVACEALDIQAIHRQMRALELLGEESARALFFAASRRLMLDLLRGRTDTTARLTSMAAAAAEQASLADAWMVLKAMDAYSAAQSGDTASCEAGAAECEAFALAEGVTVLCAEAAFLWGCAGRLDRARALVHTFHGRVLDDLPRDVNWLLILQCVLEAALAVADREVAEKAARLLTPYDGRAVFNAGAVMFHGVTDDTLARAAALLGDPDRASRLRARALATYERIGAQWWRDRLASWRPPVAEDVSGGSRRVHLHPVPGGLWLAGPEGAAVPLRALRGFGYLRELLRRPGQPVAALDLVGAGTGVAVESGLGDLLDKQALNAYRQRLRDLEQELTEAEEWSDIGRLDAIRAERDALLDELSRATGLGGRVRTTGSSQERARVAVKKAISAATDRIATVDAPLARHLQTGIHTGLNCSYEPDPADHLDWVLDWESTQA